MCNLLDNEELKKIKNNKTIYHAYDQCELVGKTPITLNLMSLTNRITGTIMDQYVDHKLREKARKEVVHQQKQQIHLASQKQFNSAVWMTELCFLLNNLLFCSLQCNLECSILLCTITYLPQTCPV